MLGLCWRVRILSIYKLLPTALPTLRLWFLVVVLEVMWLSIGVSIDGSCCTELICKIEPKASLPSDLLSMTYEFWTVTPPLGLSLFT